VSRQAAPECASTKHQLHGSGPATRFARQRATCDPNYSREGWVCEGCWEFVVKLRQLDAPVTCPRCFTSVASSAFHITQETVRTLE